MQREMRTLNQNRRSCRDKFKDKFKELEGVMEEIDGNNTIFYATGL